MATRKLNEQEDIFKVVTGSIRLEHIPSKLYGNATRVWKRNHWDKAQV